MSKTLWTFGCSFTESLKSMEDRDIETSPNNTFTQYKKFLDGELPPSWPDILSNKLNFSLQNKGIGGSSNYSIFHTFIRNIDKIKSDDLIIFQWSSLLRFRVVEESKFVDVLPNQNFTQNFSKQTIDEILINRDNKLWVDEISEFTKFIIEYCKSKKIKILFWTHDTDILKFIDKKIYKNFFIKKEFNNKLVAPMLYILDYCEIILNKGATIDKETNGEIKDGHLGIHGHRVMADMVYDVLQNS